MTKTRPIPQHAPNRSPDTPQEGRNRPLRVHPPRHPSGRGIDLSVWWRQIENIVIRKRARHIRAAGLEVEDILQVVALRIHRANSGRAPYDPRRASMASYVIVQADSAIRNEMAKRRVRPALDFGIYNADGDLVDVRQADIEDPSGGDEASAILDCARSPEHALALQLMAEGATTLEVLAACGPAPAVLRELAARGTP